MDPIVLFERTAVAAGDMARKVSPQQLGGSTPCEEWDVAALLEHMAGGPNYLLASLGIGVTSAESWPAAQVIDACVDALRAPGALERRCQSPANFEWSIAEAAAGTAMDQYVHTWDLATALGEHPDMDSDIAEAIVALFLPHMPEIGREAGLVGPAVTIDRDAPALHQLLAAMGRDPGH